MFVFNKYIRNLHKHMYQEKNTTIKLKKMMSYAGLLWIAYLFLHMLTNLNFFLENNLAFYNWFDNIFILRYGLVVLLAIALLFHVFIAIQRQLSNNQKRPISYKKSYPKAIPRVIAWFGALILLVFIIFHFIQMDGLDKSSLKDELFILFKEPITLLIYGFGLLSLGAHLHHSLPNLFQTLGLKEKPILTNILLVILIGGFLIVPISIILQ